MTRAESKLFKLWNRQEVLVIDPPLCSPAALVLLAKKYFLMDKGIYSPLRMLTVRRRWMKQQMKTPDAQGGLTCAICGKMGLLYDAPSKHNKATLDHIVEISKGGVWNDTNNFQVACDSCNNRKSN